MKRGAKRFGKLSRASARSYTHRRMIGPHRGAIRGLFLRSPPAWRESKQGESCQGRSKPDTICARLIYPKKKKEMIYGH